MTKRLLLILSLVLLLAGNCFAADVTLDLMEYANDGAAQAAYVTSQATGNVPIVSQETDSDYLELGNSGGTQWDRGQIFTLGETHTVTGLAFKFSENYGSPSGNATIRVETTSGSPPLPTGTLVHANATVTQAINASSWNDFNFTSFSLDAGTYAILCIVGDQAPDNTFWEMRFTGSGSGALYRSGVGAWGNWNGSPARDFCYRVYESGVCLQSYSEGTIKTQGTYALKGLASTIALNQTLTRAIDPVIDLTGKTQIKFDIRSTRTGGNIQLSIHDSGGTTTSKTHTISDANTYETDTWDISAVSDANKDAIDSIVIKPTNADAANTFYVDNMFGTSASTAAGSVIIIGD